MPVTVYVSPREWLYVSALITLANFERKKIVEKGKNVKEVSRYEVTKVLRPLEDFVLDKLDRLAVIARMMDILERDYGFSSEEEREEITKSVVRLVEKVAAVKKHEPERVFDFLNALRYALLGVFRGYVSPKLHEKKEGSEG